MIGLDYSDAFIAAAEALRDERKLDYARWDTGSYSSKLTASIDEDIDASRIEFVQGDASQLDRVALLQGGKAFDAILLSNLMCRLSMPAQCLAQFVDSDRYVAQGGILVIASPNTWMAEFTSPEHFLDGADSAGTLQSLAEQLPGFELLHHEDVPFMIREHRRKYEYIISQVSVWKKS